MIFSERKKFNAHFSEEKYQHFLNTISAYTQHGIPFRLAETPIFVDRSFTQQLLIAGDSICEQMLSTNWKSLTEKAIPHYALTLNESTIPQCMVIDFAIAKNKEGAIQPKLIELQGFPSLFGFEVLHDIAFKKHFDIPDNMSPYLNGYMQESYITHLAKMILGDKQKHTILLEIFPDQQKTNIDFYYTQKIINIPIVCISEIFSKDNHLYYKRDNKAIRIERIYNRVVLDELKKQDKVIQEKGALLQIAEDLEWVNHPHHFFRYSKYSIPFLKGEAIPPSVFLDQIQTLPSNLENYVLKPLFSFAGQGVIIDLDHNAIRSIPDPENWILQEKVEYASIIETPTGHAKAEIRLFYFWDEVQQKYIATLNLARLSKGKMIGVSYNQTATWVGGSLAYFEQ